MLIGVELPREFVESIIMTGRLQAPHAPVSTLLIASPESGKTSIVASKDSSAIAAFTDVTGRGLMEVCKMHPNITHIVLNDLVAIMSHRQTVNRYTMAMLNAITEEGIQALAYPDGIDVVANGKRGVIGCMTADLMKDGRSWWNKIGFVSRCLPFGFSHSGALTVKIKDTIERMEKSKKNPKKKVFRVPAKPVSVEFSNKYTLQIRRLADEKSKELSDPTGYRRLKQFLALTCGHALLRSTKRPTVTAEDVEFIERIYKYLSYTQLPQL